VEREFDILRNRLEKDFVSRYEMEQLRNSYEMALSRAKYEAEMAARDDLNEKLCQINTFIEKQVGTSVDIPLSFVHSVQQKFKNLKLSQVCCQTSCKRTADALDKTIHCICSLFVFFFCYFQLQLLYNPEYTVS